MGGGVSKETKSLMLDAVIHGDNFRVRRIIATLSSQGNKAATNMVNSISSRDDKILLALAVESGDNTTVQSLLEARADPNKKSSKDGSTALLHLPFVADELSALEIARSLLDAKAMINHANAFDQTVLFLCAGYHGFRVFKYLLDRGAKAIHFCQAFGRSLIFQCIDQGVDAATLELLIDAGAEFTEAERGRVLHTVARVPGENSADLLRVLIDRSGSAGGAQLDAQDEFGNGPIHILSATSSPSLDAIDMLLDASADIEQVNWKGQTPLIMSLMHNITADLPQLLLDRGADPNHATPANLTPLVCACRHLPRAALQPAVAALLAARGYPNLQENVTQHGPLHVLALRNDSNDSAVVAAAAAVAAAGGRVSLPDGDQRLPLHLAYATAARNRWGVDGGDMLQLLLSLAGPHDVYTRDCGGRTPQELYEEAPYEVHPERPADPAAGARAAPRREYAEWEFQVEPPPAGGGDAGGGDTSGEGGDISGDYGGEGGGGGRRQEEMDLLVTLLADRAAGDTLPSAARRNKPAAAGAAGKPSMYTAAAAAAAEMKVPAPAPPREAAGGLVARSVRRPARAPGRVPS